MSHGRNLVLLYETKPYVTLLSSDNLVHIKSLFYPKIYDIIKIRSYGSCNGVFCLKASCELDENWFHELIMWNPATREVHRIPPIRCLTKEIPLYGFGVDDPNSTDFKVVKLHTSYGIAEVYSLSTKSWIPIQHPPPFTVITGRRRSKFNPLVNGVYHWIINNPYDINYRANILCFDFRSNQFQHLTGPTISYEDYNFIWDDVAEINGSLAYVAYVLQHNFCYSACLKIWVMDQSGWNEKYSMDPIAWQFLLHGFSKNGTQFFGGYHGGPLTSRDHQGNTTCQFQFDVHTIFSVHEYVPSIAPLDRTRHY